MAQTISVLGIDIATLVFHGVGMDDTGHVVLRKRIARRALRRLIATRPPALMGMEACGSAHDWARCFREPGQQGKRIAPPFVNASVQSPKHDARDAEAICEAVTRPNHALCADQTAGAARSPGPPSGPRAAHHSPHRPGP